MPRGLKRFHGTRDLHFITFSCYRRQALLGTPRARRTFELVLEQVRSKYNFFITGYVVMPEHVHLLISEPKDSKLITALQCLKQTVAHQLGSGDHFWHARYYDFNVWSRLKQKEKLRYIHRNPVKRGLVSKPEDWEWSSFRHWLTGQIGVVEVESQWTARRREEMGTPLRAKFVEPEPKAPPLLRRNGAPSTFS